MEVVMIQCPNCKGTIDVDQTKEKCFCMYCRTEVFVKNSSNKEGATLDSLIRKGFLSIEYSDWSKALEVFDQASSIEPENGKIYVGKLLAELQLNHEEELSRYGKGLSRYANYQKAVRFADVELKSRLEGYGKGIKKISFKVRTTKKSRRNEVDGLQRDRVTIVTNHAQSNATLGKPKNKIIALLLCFFLGIFGMHKFYEGKKGMGIVYLFTLGLFGFGFISDLFILLSKPNPYYVKS